MDKYLICYDLHWRREYKPLWDALIRLGARRGLESNWWLERNGTNAVALRDHLKPYIDSDDSILVVQVSGWAGTRLKAAPSDAVTA